MGGIRGCKENSGNGTCYNTHARTVVYIHYVACAAFNFGKV